MINQADLSQYLTENIDKFKDEGGIILLMYSIVMTKGVNDIKKEIGEA